MDDEVGAWRALLLAHAAAVRAIEADLAAAGHVPLSWYDVLLELAVAPEDRLRMADLASRVVLSRTRVSRLVDELTRAGLVRREPDPADGRAAFAVITAAGRERLAAAAPAYLDGVRHHFARHVPPRDLAAVRRAMEAVTAAHRPPLEIGRARSRATAPAAG